MNDTLTEQSQFKPVDGLADHVVLFARLLRRMNLRIGTGTIIAAVAAVQRLGIRDPNDLETCLFSFFIQRHEHRDLFHKAFALYWRQSHLRRSLAMPYSAGAGLEDSEDENVARRLAEQLAEEDAQSEQASTEQVLELSQTASRQESLQQKDFESMSVEELQEAETMLRRLRLPADDLPSRRFRPGVTGPRLDMRASLRAALRADGLMPLKKQQRRLRQSPVVVLCDISGSMSVYSRMFLHFMHAVSNDRDRVHSFVFGTQLSNISRQLRFRDVDKALAASAQVVQDWSGGTRIEESLRSFNRLWSRRVLAQGALVLLISDGLDRGEGRGLDKEMQRLAKSCRRLVWLNPLLRFADFEPRASGIRAMLPYVDDFRSAHNVSSLVDLVELLSPERE